MVAGVAVRRQDKLTRRASRRHHTAGGSVACYETTLRTLKVDWIIARVASIFVRDVRELCCTDDIDDLHRYV